MTNPQCSFISFIFESCWFFSPVHFKAFFTSLGALSLLDDGFGSPKLDGMFYKSVVEGHLSALVLGMIIFLTCLYCLFQFVGWLACKCFGLDTFILTFFIFSTMLVNMTLIHLLVLIFALFKLVVYIDVVSTFTLNRLAFLQKKKKKILVAIGLWWTDSGDSNQIHKTQFE